MTVRLVDSPDEAPDFYRRHGFEVAGEVGGYPAGHSYHLMRKPLT